jgi:hypothetical protein
MSLATIKAAIKSNLDELVADEVLGGATISELKQDPLKNDTPSFPHAYLTPPSIGSEVSDNRTNIRTYTFDIMVLFQAENLASTTELEEKIEAIIEKFDNDPTLGGTAQGGVLPVASSPEPLQHMSKELILVVVQIEAKQLATLTFG